MTSNSFELQVLVVGASSDETARVVGALSAGGYHVKPKCAFNVGSFDLHIRRQAFDLVFWSDSSAGFGLSAGLELMNGRSLCVPVIELKDTVNEADRVNALKSGARDAVCKTNLDHLLLVVERELVGLSERRRSAELERRYADSQRICFELLQSSNTAVSFVRDGRHIHANPAYRQLFGYSYMTELKGLPLTEIVSADDAHRVGDFIGGLERSGGAGEIEVVGLGPGGSEFTVQLKVSSTRFDGEEAYQILAADRSTKRVKERPPSHHDHLTGLVSHQYFLELLENEVAATHAQGGGHVLFLIELEHFRSIRDMVGIAGADLVIQQLAQAVHESVGEANTLARFADYTFTLFIPNSNPERAEQLAERIRTTVESHIADVAGRSVSATCSIGIVAITRMTGSAQEALTHADLACRTAIKAGGNRIHRHERDGASDDQIERSKVSGAEIREAMAAGRLSLSFQPVVSLHGQIDEIFHVQLQVQDEFGNLIGHDALTQSAVEGDVALHLDRWIIEQLLLTMQQPDGPGSRASLFVRLSDESVTEPTLVLELGRLLTKTGVEPSRLIFELSQSVATGQVRFARGFVAALKRLGCGAALARFGADSNSFRALKNLDVDFLKIDESITADLLENPDHVNMLGAIQETARLMDKVTVAGWVQDANSLALLWEHGVGYVQGDYIQGPVIELSQGDDSPGYAVSPDGVGRVH